MPKNEAKRVELTGEKVVNAPQARVYDALHDIVILRQAVPGVQTLTKQGDGRYLITAALAVGPLRPAFTGTLEVYNEDRPSGYSLRGEAGGGSGGAVGGYAHVALAAIDLDTTNLAFHVTADLSGRIASLEWVKLDVTGRTLIAEFFARLQSLLDGEEIEPEPALAAASPAAAEPGALPAAAEPAEPHADAPRAPYQPPRFPPPSDYPDLDRLDAAARSPAASTTDATGGLLAAEPAPEPAPPSRQPGNLPQTPYRPAYSLGYDSAVHDGSGSGLGRWLMAAAGLALIALLLNGGFSGVGF